MADNQYKTLQKQGGAPREVAQVVRGLMDGKSNNTGEVTLDTGSTTTVVTEFRAGAKSYIGLMPQTSNAAAEIGNGTIYVSSRGDQQFTLTHASNAQNDRTFTYVVIG
jgi:hypothetical protein